jgi:hypothetical protein
VLAVLLIICAAAFFGFRKYIAYTDTGKLYLDIPWLEGYLGGPPENDELAEYMAPVERESSDNSEETDKQDSGGDFSDNGEVAEPENADSPKNAADSSDENVQNSENDLPDSDSAQD